MKLYLVAVGVVDMCLSLCAETVCEINIDAAKMGFAVADAALGIVIFVLGGWLAIRGALPESTS